MRTENAFGPLIGSSGGGEGEPAGENVLAKELMGREDLGAREEEGVSKQELICSDTAWV